VDFEQALRVELISIPELNNKVFPLFAKEGTQTPYLVYSGSYEPFKTLDGITNDIKGECDLNLICKTYEELNSLCKKINDKLITFQSRNIGVNGPFIQDISVKTPIKERDGTYYVALIEIIVNYEEV
jgi:hypothetical protein